MADENRWPFPTETDPTPQEFVQWVEKNLPSGTVVHNPKWWATRIWRAAEYAAAGVPVMPDDWQISAIADKHRDELDGEKVLDEISFGRELLRTFGGVLGTYNEQENSDGR